MIVTDLRVAVFKNDVQRWWSPDELTSVVVHGGFTSHIALVGPDFPPKKLALGDFAHAPHGLQLGDGKRAARLADAVNAIFRNPTAHAQTRPSRDLLGSAWRAPCSLRVHPAVTSRCGRSTDRSDHRHSMAGARGHRLGAHSIHDHGRVIGFDAGFGRLKLHDVRGRNASGFRDAQATG